MVKVEHYVDKKLVSGEEVEISGDLEVTKAGGDWTDSVFSVTLLNGMKFYMVVVRAFTFDEITKL